MLNSCERSRSMRDIVYLELREKNIEINMTMAAIRFLWAWNF